MTSRSGLSDRPVAIVTAAGQGIGAACARSLAAAGYALVLQTRGEGAEALARELGGTGVRGSVTSAPDLERLVRTAMELHGRIDAVVVNAGHVARGDLLALDDEAWHDGLDMLLLSVIRLARLVTPIMVRQGGGAFVNISSFGAIEPSAGFPVSSTIRAGLGAFVKLYGDRYAPSGIRMNSVLPGMVDNYPIEAEVLATIPLGRPVRTTEIGETVRFLLSEAAGAITGQQIVIDGGSGRSF